MRRQLKYLLFIFALLIQLASAEEAVLKRVVDGDTLVVLIDGKKEKVRLLCFSNSEYFVKSIR